MKSKAKGPVRAVQCPRSSGPESLLCPHQGRLVRFTQGGRLAVSRSPGWGVPPAAGPSGPPLPSHPGEGPRRLAAGPGPPPAAGLKPVPASRPQRWNPVGGFCEKLLPSDRWPWSDVTGLQHRPLEEVAMLPSPHWEWESDWYVDENFGGEPTEKGVGELGSCRGSAWGGNALGSARPLSAVPSIPLPCVLPTFCTWSVGISAVPPSACSLPPPALSLPSARALQSPSLVFQGWTYAMDFPATYTRDKKWNSYVRRRRWIRYRRYKSCDTWAKVGACLWPGRGQG